MLRVLQEVTFVTNAQYVGNLDQFRALDDLLEFSKARGNSPLLSKNTMIGNIHYKHLKVQSIVETGDICLRLSLINLRILKFFQVFFHAKNTRYF
jgi:hypothetical protein